MYDILVVGAGTAGLSAAIYGVRAGKSVLILESVTYGGQIINTQDIENYPGIKHISGFEFATGLYEQAKDLGAEIKIEQVLGIEDVGNFIIKTNKATYEARSVILATGARNRPLGLPNEEKLVGSGISYCATCDGMFYRGKVVAVNGGGNTALEDAIFLSNVAKKVYIIHRRDAFRGEDALQKIIATRENIELVLDSTIEEIIEKDFALAGIKVHNKNTDESHVLDIDGLFVAIGQMPENEIFANLVELSDAGYIVASEDCRTSHAGIFAAGDGRTKHVRQLATAASDGAIAALAAADYVQRQ